MLLQCKYKSKKYNFQTRQGHIFPSTQTTTFFISERERKYLESTNKQNQKKKKKEKPKRKKGGTTVCMPEHNKQVITDTSLSLESFVTYIEKHFTWVGKEGKHFSKRKRNVLLKMFSYECNFCSSSCCCLRCNFA